MKYSAYANKANWKLSLMLGIFSAVAVATSALASKPTPVIVMEAYSDRFVDHVEAIGSLRANESVDLTVAVTETVTSIHFEDGQRVKKGDILVEMTSSEEHAMIEEAQSTLTEAKKQYDRVLQASQNGAVARSQLDESRREYETARARLKAVESRLRDRLVKAPFSGVMGLRNISVGALIEPGDIISTLDDDSVMKLDFPVPATFLSTLKEGIRVVARAPAFEDREFEGEIASIGTRIDTATRAVTARAILPNPERTLKPGLLMKVELFKNPRQAVVIDEEALLPSGRENYVLVVDRSRENPVPERRKIVLGARRPGQVEILDGLSPGEFVITHGAIRVRPGQPVRVSAVDTGDEPLSKLLKRQ